MSLRHVTGVTLGLGLWLLAGHGPIGAAQPASTMDATAARAVVARYCVACHNERTLAGDLSLDSLDLAATRRKTDCLGREVARLRLAHQRHRQSSRHRRANSLDSQGEHCLGHSAAHAEQPPAGVHAAIGLHMWRTVRAGQARSRRRQGAVAADQQLHRHHLAG